MRKILLLVVGLSIALCSACVFADDDFVVTREKAGLSEDRYQDMRSTTVLSAHGQTLASLTVPITIYRVMITSTAATSAVGIYDTTDVTATPTADCKFEIYEATNGAGHYIDFGDDPIRLTTGLGVLIDDANVVIHYRDQWR